MLNELELRYLVACWPELADHLGKHKHTISERVLWFICDDRPTAEQLRWEVAAKLRELLRVNEISIQYLGIQWGKGPLDRTIVHVVDHPTPLSNARTVPRSLGTANRAG